MEKSMTDNVMRRALLLLATTLLVVLVSGQLFVAGCQEQRACRNNTACQVVPPPTDGGTTPVDAGQWVYGFLCNVDTALCYTSCTDDKQCDVCKGFFCNDKGNCVKDATKTVPSDVTCCTADTGCKTFACNVGLGQCRTKCRDNTQCNRCNGFACKSGLCSADSAVVKPDGCPQPEPAPEPVVEPTPEPVADGGTGDAGTIEF